MLGRQSALVPLLVSACLAVAGPAGAADRNASWRSNVTAFAAQHFKNPAWGFSHSQRDYALARSLAAADKATLDDDVLFAAAYLHDMGTFPPWTDNKTDHADIAAAAVGTILAGTGFPMAKIDAVRSAIRTHMYDRNPGSSPEARYLHDADALDWLGAIGVARDFMVVDPNGASPRGQDAIKDIEDNRTTIASRLVTPAGKAQVASRIAEQNTFLDALRRETDNFSKF
jgi:HD superfamily phosphodiesterase